MIDKFLSGSFQSLVTEVKLSVDMPTRPSLMVKMKVAISPYVQSWILTIIKIAIVPYGAKNKAKEWILDNVRAKDILHSRAFLNIAFLSFPSVGVE